MKKFILYSTEHCHLCELAEAILVSTLNPALHSVEVEDISYSDLLLARYGVRIPVLIDMQSKKELQWPFDASTVSEFVN